MGFQQTVGMTQAYGEPGMLAFTGPARIMPGPVKGDPANIVVGRFFTQDVDDGQFLPGGEGALGGVLVHSKALALNGTTAGGTLAPTLNVTPGTICEFMSIGEVFVIMTTDFKIGDPVFFVVADGELGAGAPTGGQTAIPGARVEKYSGVAGDGAVISLTGLK